MDATDKVLGRLAAEVSRRLRGKHKPEFTPHVDTGDFVIVLNAEKIRVTGSKAEHREYQTYSGYPSGLHIYSYERMNRESPEKVIELAVRRMLPKSKLGQKMLGKLKVYRGNKHDHQAQQPKALEL